MPPLLEQVPDKNFGVLTKQLENALPVWYNPSQRAAESKAAESKVKEPIPN